MMRHLVTRHLVTWMIPGPGLSSFYRKESDISAKLFNNILGIANDIRFKNYSPKKEIQK